jgi:uncharacterized protein (DUF608 family)
VKLRQEDGQLDKETRRQGAFGCKIAPLLVSLFRLLLKPVKKRLSLVPPHGRRLDTAASRRDAACCVQNEGGRSKQRPYGRLSIFGSLSILFVSLSVLSARAQQAAPATQKPKTAIPEYDLTTGTIHSARWISGVPLGGIGCGAFEILSDGTVSHATINNNWDKPTGDLKGCFAALWTNAGGRLQARALKLKSEYNLPTVSNLDYRGLYPQAFISYPDTTLPVTVSLRAYNPIIPHDVKNSNLPVAIFVFTVKNEAHAPVEASIALSWENFIGVGGSATRGAFANRTGNKVAVVPSSEGIFGLSMTGPDRLTVDPPHRLIYNAQGNYALLANPTTPETQVTSASWNAQDGTPGWWPQFAKDGSVSGTVGEGKEGTVHPAGVIALKISLKDRETREIPFAVAWYTPRLYTLGGTEFGHLYEKNFDDALDVGRYALENRQNLLATTEEWQNRLTRSSLPSWLSRKIINDAYILSTNTILTRDSGAGGTIPGPPLFALLENPAVSPGAFGNMDERMLGSALTSTWFPGLDVQELRQFSKLQVSNGALPRTGGSLDDGISKDPGGASPLDNQIQPAVVASYLFQVARLYRWTGDQAFLDRFYPSLKHAMEYALSLSRPEHPENSNALSDSEWLAFLKTGEQVALAMYDRAFATRCSDQFKKIQGTNPKFNLAAQWQMDILDLGPIVPKELLDKTVNEAIREVNAANFTLPIEHGLDFETAVLLHQGYSDAATKRSRFLHDLEASVSNLHWRYEKVLSQHGKTFVHGARFTDSGSWYYLYALEGFSLNLPEGRMILAPKLGAGMKSLSAPIFAPTFWATMDYRPTAGGMRLNFRLDRMMPLADVTLERKPKAPGAIEPKKEANSAPLLSGASLNLKEIVLPSASENPMVSASIGRAPVPGKVTRDAQGRLLFVFETPIQMTAGQQLEFNIR